MESALNIGKSFVPTDDDWAHATLAVHVPAITSDSLRFICCTLAYTAAAHILKLELLFPWHYNWVFFCSAWFLPSNIFALESYTVNPTNCISTGLTEPAADVTDRFA